MEITQESAYARVGECEVRGSNKAVEFNGTFCADARLFVQKQVFVQSPTFPFNDLQAAAKRLFR